MPSSYSSSLLDVQALSVTFETPKGPVHAVRNLSFQIGKGECLGIVGESGSGKSQSMMALMGLLPENGKTSGQALFSDHNLLDLPIKTLNALRGARIGMIFQDPLTSLTPHLTVSTQLKEVLANHRKIKGAEADKICLDWLERVRIPDAARRMNQFPHELSGGMRQRVMIASAMLCEPEILIADEPTTALDVTVQAQVLELMDELKRDLGTSILLITHDMGVVARMCDNVVVMRQGEMVETADVETLFSDPEHNYTRMLLDAMPRLDNKDTTQRLSTLPIDLDAAPILKVRDLRTEFEIKTPGKFFGSQKHTLHAVDGVSFDLLPGETLGIVGESGCGKSTLARSVLRLIEPNSGGIAWLGRDLTQFSKQEMRQSRDSLQIVFQDPMASLNPRMTIGQSIAEPLTTFRPDLSGNEKDKNVCDMLERVGLDPALRNRYPHEFSGGQNQRVGIARAMILKPKLIICDEAVSALDVSIQAQIIKLLADLQREFAMSMLFISHDLSVVKEISHRVMVMYLGRVVEMGLNHQIFQSAHHPYTKALLNAVPKPDPVHEKNREKLLLKGDLPSPIDPKAGLRFLKSRLSETSQDQYRPLLVEVGDGHFVAEHDPMKNVSKGLILA